MSLKPVSLVELAKESDVYVDTSVLRFELWSKEFSNLFKRIRKGTQHHNFSRFFNPYLHQARDLEITIGNCPRIKTVEGVIGEYNPFLKMVKDSVNPLSYELRDFSEEISMLQEFADCNRRICQLLKERVPKQRRYGTPAHGQAAQLSRFIINKNLNRSPDKRYVKKVDTLGVCSTTDASLVAHAVLDVLKSSEELEVAIISKDSDHVNIIRNLSRLLKEGLLPAEPEGLQRLPLCGRVSIYSPCGARSWRNDYSNGRDRSFLVKLLCNTNDYLQ